MSERIDHVAEAMMLRRHVETESFPAEAASAYLAGAQVHATLALVEQQRIANLISLNEQWQDTGHAYADSVSPVLRDNVKEALGL